VLLPVTDLWTPFIEVIFGVAAWENYAFACWSFLSVFSLDSAWINPLYYQYQGIIISGQICLTINGWASGG
jgi:hypothetical protein